MAERYKNRLPRATGLLSQAAGFKELEQLQPSNVYVDAKRRLSNVNVDEDFNPESGIAARKPLQSKNIDVSDQELEALAKADEIEAVLRRLSSYIAVVPELGSSFAYINFKNNFDYVSAGLTEASKEATLKELQKHWNFVENNLFKNNSSLSLAIQGFVQKWLTFGPLYAAIIRENQGGKILQIYVQIQPFTEHKEGKTKLYWSTEVQENKQPFYIWEEADMFELNYAELSPYQRSYVASLRYAYNTFKNVERTRVANAVMAAQFRSIYTVPTTGLGKVKARAKLSSVMGLYKREITLSKETGEVMVNGENSYPVNTELWVSETSSGKVTIENPGDGNVQLNNTDLVEYFMRKFYKKSILPISKYEAVDTGYLSGLSEIDEDERQFNLAVANHRAVLAGFFLAITWRYISVLPEYVGRKEIQEALTMTFYDEPKNLTPEEKIDGYEDRLSKIQRLLQTYKTQLEEVGFSERQQKARLNVLRYKLMMEFMPDFLEQNNEDYRGVPKQESPASADAFDTTDKTGDFGSDFGDSWGSDSGYDSGSDDFGDYSDDDWGSDLDDGGTDDEWDFNF